MSEQKKKPKIEDIISEYHDEDTKKNALDFVAFLRENKLSPTRMHSDVHWVVKHKGKSVCHLNIDKNNEWMIRHCQFTREKWFVNYEQHITDENLKAYILDNIRDPANVCIGGGCKGKQNKTILGKKFAAVCNCWPLLIKNPKGDILENEKKLITVIKTVIADFTTANKAQ